MLFDNMQPVGRSIDHYKSRLLNDSENSASPSKNTKKTPILSLYNPASYETISDNKEAENSEQVN